MYDNIKVSPGPGLGVRALCARWIFRAGSGGRKSSALNKCSTNCSIEFPSEPSIRPIDPLIIYITGQYTFF